MNVGLVLSDGNQVVHRQQVSIINLLLLLFVFQETFACDGLVYNALCIEIKITIPKTHEDFASWNDAKLDCDREGYRLASIDTKEKREEIQQYFKKEINDNSYICIGLSRKKGLERFTNKNWIWSSGETLVQYDKFWRIGDPNVPDQDCAGVALSGDSFVDFGCDEKPRIGLTYLYEYLQETLTTKDSSQITTNDVLATEYTVTRIGSTTAVAYTEKPEDDDSFFKTVKNVNVTLDNVEDISGQLADATEKIDDIEDEEVLIRTASLLEDIVSLNSTSPKVTTSVAATVDNLMKTSDEVIEMSEESVAATSTAVKSLEEQLSTVATAGMNYNFSRNNLDIEVVQLQDTISTNGLVFYSGNKDTASLVPVKDLPNSDVETSLTLPPDVYDAAEESASAVFVLYRQATLFPISSKSSNKNWTVGSSVISATIFGSATSYLKSPVIGMYMPSENYSIPKDVDRIRCVFWDFKLLNGVGDWSSEGCEYNSTKNGYITCHCNHLTNFAVLMDYQGQMTDSDMKGHVLSVLSLVGCCVSLISLFLTICTQVYRRYTMPFTRRQHSARPQLVLLNFAISLSLLYIVFVVGIEQTEMKNLCIAISGLLHYFTISSVAWMTVQAVNIYMSLVKVFPVYISKFRRKAFLFGWGMPLIPVLISLSVSLESYSTEHYCFIKPGRILYYGNIAVIGALFLINFATFCLVIRVLFCSKRRVSSRENDNISVVKEQLLTAIGLSILLGLTWIFGFAAIGESTSSSNFKFIMQLLFCIFNSLQGLFVFLFFAVRTGDFKACIVWCYYGLTCKSQPHAYELKGTVSSTDWQQSGPMTCSTEFSNKS